MIRYELRCEANHEFEGWFRSISAFDDQSEAGEVACPVCGTTDVSRAPMAPAVGRSRSNGPPVDPVTFFRALRRHIETNCQNVGTNFAEEARKIHYGEVDPHGIYGDATPGEAEELAEEGIEIAAVPWIPLNDN